jgi:hypothetical protein
LDYLSVVRNHKNIKYIWILYYYINITKVINSYINRYIGKNFMKFNFQTCAKALLLTSLIATFSAQAETCTNTKDNCYCYSGSYNSYKKTQIYFNSGTKVVEYAGGAKVKTQAMDNDALNNAWNYDKPGLKKGICAS